MFRTIPLSIIRSFHCTHSNGICHTVLLTACEQDQDGTAVWEISESSWFYYKNIRCRSSECQIQKVSSTKLFICNPTKCIHGTHIATVFRYSYMFWHITLPLSVSSHTNVTCFNIAITALTLIPGSFSLLDLKYQVDDIHKYVINISATWYPGSSCGMLHKMGTIALIYYMLAIFKLACELPDNCQVTCWNK